MVSAWKGRKSCTKRELQSLIGHLQHACWVVQSGTCRTFLRRMINLSMVAKELHHHLRLNKGFQSDLQWWWMFLEIWNGVSMLNSTAVCPPAVTLTSDASGSWGCGAFLSTGEWFMCPWPPNWAKMHISVKKLFPSVLACALWGHQWRGKMVSCLSDNTEAVAILRSGISQQESVMQLMCTLWFIKAYHSIYTVANHVAGAHNLANSLSRDNPALFLRQVPSARRVPTTVPTDLRQLLLESDLDWTSESWTVRLISILIRV